MGAVFRLSQPIRSRKTAPASEIPPSSKSKWVS